ncbi:MAG: T9SS type A sorting domain-containing protein [Bacteroidetes bacterium]|nr:T9SS type A sorting domain-containing protein [Bacteroidota bacterium]
MKYIFKSLFYLLFITIFPGLQAQTFTQYNTSITNVAYGASAWGDYDKDGDLDLLLCGDRTTGSFYAGIFRNDNGSFVNTNAGLTGLAYASAEWGDFDNDNDLDIILSGYDINSTPVSQIYRNDNNSFVFLTELSTSVADGESTWGDYDNDGDLDILVVGSYKITIFRNNGDGTFTDIIPHLQELQSASARWVDFDNDGDLDILISGDSGGGFVTKLYRNTAGDFQVVDAGFPGLSAGTINWGDLDNDGDMDLIITGFDDALDPQFFVYRNDGNDLFTEINTYITGIALSSLDLGDVDNDGDLDMVFSGKSAGCGSQYSAMYRNMGNWLFFDMGATLVDLKRSSVSFGDFDNDGDIDVFLSGLNGYDDAVSALFRNENGANAFVPNTNPTAPDGLLTASSDGSDITFSWNRAQDAQTPSDGLSYNLRVGTTSGGHEILSSMSCNCGFNKRSALGNVNQDTSWNLLSLSPGTYYWSVQALDNGGMASVFATEQSFTVLPAGIAAYADHVSVTVYPNPANDILFVRFDSQDKPQPVTIYNGQGHQVWTGFLKDQEYIDVSRFSTGLYHLKTSRSGVSFIVQ